MNLDNQREFNGMSGKSLQDDISDYIDCINSTDNSDLVHSPVLALGVSERVGSNWFLDTLNKSLHTHNEPFRQQLHRSHPLSTMSIDPISPSEYELKTMHPYELHWFRNFVASKYSERPHVIKETNLFFSAKNLLDLFPDSSVIMLTRDPVGIASSFVSDNLFERWNYRERYNRLKDVTMQPEYDKYRIFFGEESDGDGLRELVRLIMLNTHLLNESLTGRDQLMVGYEESVMNRQAVLARLSHFLIDKGIDVDGEIEQEKYSVYMESSGDFNTRKRKTNLTAYLTSEDMATIKDETGRTLEAASTELSPTSYAMLEDAFGTRQPYEYIGSGRKKINRARKPLSVSERPSFEFVSEGEGRDKWLNQPVSNANFVDFLNIMQKAGVSNVVNGTQLFVNENMITERGGRIAFNVDIAQYEVAQGYENYPVYWVTWLGAASYARYKGCRLPSKKELERLTESHLEEFNPAYVNAGHKQPDASPIGYFPANRIGMYDLIGNVASWCRDGSDGHDTTAVGRYMFGSAWNRDDTKQEFLRAKERPINGCSRGVGIRLIEDIATALSPQEIAKRFDEWYKYMTNYPDLRDSLHDQYIIDKLIE